MRPNTAFCSFARTFAPLPPPRPPTHSPPPPAHPPCARSDADPSTLTRWILAEQRKHPEAAGELTIILNAIQVAVKTVTSAVRRAGLTNLYGLAGGSNVQGEEVKKLDLIANKCVRAAWGVWVWGGGLCWGVEGQTSYYPVPSYRPRTHLARTRTPAASSSTH